MKNLFLFLKHPLLMGLIAFSMLACNSDDTANQQLDKLVRIPIGSPDFTVCDSNWLTTPFDTWMIHDFNKKDYSNVSSIQFVPSLFCSNDGDIITAELYNVTDGKSIANSQVTHNTTSYKVEYSANIYNDLPDYPITLAIRLKNSTDGNCSGTGTFSYLYIKRK